MTGLILSGIGTTELNVAFQIETSDDLGGTWSPFQTVQHTIPLPDTKVFLRIQADGLPE